MTLKSLLGTAVLALVAAACSQGDARPNDQAAAPSAPAATEQPAAATGSQTRLGTADATPTGNVIEVKMITDDRGNYFEPAEIEAKPGDVIRFSLVSGVHNVHFPAAQNAGVAGLPGPSEMLQLPGQTYEVLVALGEGKYPFQCDPHAALGMVGTLEVEVED
jgi:plastocyanin